MGISRGISLWYISGISEGISWGISCLFFGEFLGNKMQRGSGCNGDKGAIRNKMQQGSRCNKDQDATRINMQQGSRCNEDEDATWIKMQRGSRFTRLTSLNMKKAESALFTMSSYHTKVIGIFLTSR